MISNFESEGADKVKVEDRKTSFSNLPHTCMDFGNAIHAMKNGKAVARKGWNRKGMFLYYVGPGNYSPCTDIAKKLVNENGLVPYAPYIAMKTVDGTVVPWLASQTDILAEDWEVVEI